MTGAPSSSPELKRQMNTAFSLGSTPQEQITNIAERTDCTERSE
jgi:hypothetical protein